MIEPRFRWRFPDATEPDPAVRAAAVAAGSRHSLDERVAGLLTRRGLLDGAAFDAFFAPPLEALHDPGLLPDAARFEARIARARRDRERVMVFGDFDADGLTGLAILVSVFDRLGIATVPYVPSRIDEGHGLSLAAVAAARDAGATVIVTVDCGTTSAAEIAAAAASGIDVLVTDHHRVPPELPAATAIVNPQRPDSAYPERRLAGSGVAFKLGQLLLAGEPGGPATALAFADLATVGSVADVVPILGETRAIVQLGLDRLRTEPRPGIAALLAASGVAPAAVDVETLGFAIAPRINAASRVGEAMVAARLLLAEDAATAEGLATELEAANLTRRDLTKQAIAEARAALTGAPAEGAPATVPPDRPATIVSGPWPVGIVGLVASRLVDELGRPAIVGAQLGDVIRASCRSDGSLDLGAALEACADLFNRHGGHAGAAGFEIAADRWPAFVERFEAIAAGHVPPDPRRIVDIDLALPAGDVDYALHRGLARLAPCGTGNPEPVVAILGLTVTRSREANGGHSQLTLKRSLDVLDGIAFGRPDLATTVHEGDRVDVVGRLASRRFGGFESLQVEIRDVASSGSHPESAAILGLAGEKSSPDAGSDGRSLAGASA
ncbi:MAG TPA: single-stranded-DNA-specific exonuclease RecJ [Candidatus Limnocylindrales bacterium]|nr:single-stranded-DNA-specific exonuclease RecJ [Candidatus Limnocylindrales bacterium]